VPLGSAGVTDLPEDAPERSEDALDVPELPGDALVVRGGDPQAPGQIANMIRQAQDSHGWGEGYALSTYAGWDPSKSREELIRDIARLSPIPNRQLAVTTVRQVIDAGFKLVPDTGGNLPCHVNVDLESNPDPDLVTSAVTVYVCPVSVGPSGGSLGWLTGSHCGVWLAGCECVRSVMTRAIA